MRPRDLDQLSDDASEGMRRLVRQALRKVDRILRAVDPDGFEQFIALSRKQAIERVLEELQAEAAGRLPGVAELGARLAHAQDGSLPVAIDTTVLARAQRNAAREVRNVVDGVRRTLNRTVLRSLTGELDRAELEQEIRQAFDGDVLEARVERIARTEVGEAFMQQAAADDEAFIAAGADLIKRWVSVDDHRTRESHEAIDGQERELDELFSVGQGATASTPPGGGGHQANAPLDPTLPPEERINCRCTYVRVPRSEARQSYISATPRPRVDSSAAAVSGTGQS